MKRPEGRILSILDALGWRGMSGMAGMGEELTTSVPHQDSFKKTCFITSGHERENYGVHSPGPQYYPDDSGTTKFDKIPSYSLRPKVGCKKSSRDPPFACQAGRSLPSMVFCRPSRRGRPFGTSSSRTKTTSSQARRTCRCGYGETCRPIAPLTPGPRDASGLQLACAGTAIVHAASGWPVTLCPAPIPQDKKGGKFLESSPQHTFGRETQRPEATQNLSGTSFISEIHSKVANHSVHSPGPGTYSPDKPMMHDRRSPAGLLFAAVGLR